MSVTTTPLTPAELRAGLQERLDLATQYAALESRIESKALELQRSDWEFTQERPFRYMNAVGGELRCVYDAANQENGYNALDFCQSIQDALDVLDFAIERGDDAR
jgi:hypothetical protein